MKNMDRFIELNEKVNTKHATLSEKNEFMEMLYEDGSITEDQLTRYKKGEDADFLLSIGIIAGANMLLGILLDKKLKSMSKESLRRNLQQKATSMKNMDRFIELNWKVNKKRASRAEKKEFMEMLYENGSISEDQLKRYKKGENADFLLSIGIISGTNILLELMLDKKPKAES